MTLPAKISDYASVTSLLDPIVEGVRTHRYTDNQWVSFYDPVRRCPDLGHNLAEKSRALIDFADHKNLFALAPELSTAAGEAMTHLLNIPWKRSSVLWYPALNGFMDWHTNYSQPGSRIYLVWNAEDRKSQFFSSPDGKKIESFYEPAGWSVNLFTIRDAAQPFWHGLTSGGTDRISIGFKRA